MCVCVSKQWKNLPWSDFLFDAWSWKIALSALFRICLRNRSAGALFPPGFFSFQVFCVIRLRLELRCKTKGCGLASHRATSTTRAKEGRRHGDQWKKSTQDKGFMATLLVLIYRQQLTIIISFFFDFTGKFFGCVCGATPVERRVMKWKTMKSLPGRVVVCLLIGLENSSIGRQSS